MLAITHKLNMLTTRPDAMGIIMEDLIKNFEELSSEESYVDVGDEDGKAESVDVFGGKPMEDYPRSLFTAPTNNTQAVDRKQYVVDAFVRAVGSYFTFHVLQTNTRKQRTSGYLHDHWLRLFSALDKDTVYILFKANLSKSEKALNTTIFTYEFEDMWKLLKENLLMVKEFNWLQKLVVTEVMCDVYGMRA